jgi:hypothetical protein
MTDPKQPLYDILGEAFKAGRTYVTEGYDLSAATILFPLAARMEETVQKLINDEIRACAQVAEDCRDEIDVEADTPKMVARYIQYRLLARSLPSSPERET